MTDPRIDPEDQMVADVSGTIGFLVDMLVPNEGDETTIEMNHEVFHIRNAGTFSYLDGSFDGSSAN